MAFPVNLDATWVNTASYDPGELRRADSTIFAGDGSAFGVSGGIVRHGDTSLAVTVDGSDNVTIQAGAVVIPGNAVAGTGCYRFALGAAVTNALPARDATNPRIDTIVAQARDTDVVGTHGAYTGRLAVISGTAAATPAAPSIGTMAVELARITVPATGGGSSSVDSSHRTYASAIGGEIIAASSAMLPTSAAKFQRARALDTGVRYEWDGSTWQALEWTQSGTVTITPTTSDIQKTQAVTFPRAFTSTPRVQLTASTGISDGANAYSLALWASPVSTSGFTANLRRGNTTPTAIYWTASGT